MTARDASDENFPSSGPPAAARAQPPLVGDAHGPPPTPVLTAEQIEAFSSFYRAHIERLVAFLRWYGADLPEAADVAQEAMMKAYNRWGTLANPPSWVRTVASRMFIRRRTEIREDPIEEIPDEGRHSLLLRADVPAETTAGHDAQREFLEDLATLPPRQRQVMAWTYDGYTPAEIAYELSTPENLVTSEAVRASLRLARRRLVERHDSRRDDR